MDQSLTHGYVSRFEHPALRPRLHTEGFPLTCPHRTPTQGTSTEDLGQYNNREYTTSLFTNTTSTLRDQAQSHHKTQSTSQMRDRHKANTINQPLSRGIGHKATTPKINLYTRGITQSRRVYNLVIKRPQTNFFSQKQRSYRQDRIISSSVRKTKGMENKYSKKKLGKNQK